MKVIPLGTNGFFPSFGRSTACYAIPLGTTLITLDAGSGLFRLAEPDGKNLLSKAKEIHLYLSHYHLDHTFGFYGAFELFRNKKVTVFSSQVKRVFSELTSLKYFPVDYRKVFNNFTFKQIKPGKETHRDYKYDVRQQLHRGEGSLAFRFEFSNGKKLAYVTDSEPRTEGITFVRSVDLLLHEHEEENTASRYINGINLEKLYNGGHVTTAGAAIIAREAKVKKLYLIHHNPYTDKTRLDRELRTAQKIFKNSFSANDLEAISF